MKSRLKPDQCLRSGYKDKKRIALIHLLPCLVCQEFGLKQTSRTIAHHKIGLGLGKKASDKLAMAICEKHHTNGPDGIHNMPLKEWEKRFLDQDKLIELTDIGLEGIN